MAVRDGRVAGARGTRGRGSTLAVPSILGPILLLPFALNGPNAPLAVYACLVLGAGIALLWRPGEPPILLFIFAFQWLQAATGPLYGNIVDLTLDQIAYYRGFHELACFLLLTATLVLAIGMRLTAGENVKDLHGRMLAFVARHPLQYWLQIYAVSWLVSAACETFAWQAGGLLQPLLALAQIKWAAFVLLTFATFAIPGRQKGYWLIAFGLEFVMSIGGFFSDFKSVFFYALFGLVACNVRFTPGRILVFSLFGCVMLWLGIVWTAVKVDYRDFANQGSGQQVVDASYGERIQELYRLIGQLDGPTLAKASDAFAHRLMYYELFGAAVSHVPDYIPHSGGKIWGEAITRPFMPRLLFPDKRAINDSDLTNQYTGLSVATAEQGASISMGSAAEAYIDFGPVLMFIPIGLLGAGIGHCYRWLLHLSGRDGVIGAALSTFVIMPAFAAETSILKLIPALFLCVLACLAILKFAVPYAFGPREPRLKRQRLSLNMRR